MISSFPIIFYYLHQCEKHEIEVIKLINKLIIDHHLKINNFEIR